MRAFGVVRNPLFKLVPEVGLELYMSLTSPDFESGAYTNFATPALAGRTSRRFVRPY